MSDRTPGIQPHQSIWRRIDIAARHAFPTASSLALMLVATAPFGLPDQAVLLPAIALACVYFWTLFRPLAMRPWSVFLIGLLLDLLGYLPLGVGPLSLLVAHGITMQLRRFLVRQGFLLIWLVQAGLAALVAVLVWGLSAALSFRLLPFGPALFQCVLSVAVYPLLKVIFLRAHHSIADPEQA